MILITQEMKKQNGQRKTNDLKLIAINHFTHFNEFICFMKQLAEKNDTTRYIPEVLTFDTYVQ